MSISAHLYVLFMMFHALLFKLIALLVAIAYYTIAERKVMAAIQRRRGPNVVGFWGLLQPAADGLKLIVKELTIPAHANKRIFILAPLLILTLSLLAWTYLPLHLSSSTLSAFTTNHHATHVVQLLNQLSSMECTLFGSYESVVSTALDIYSKGSSTMLKQFSLQLSGFPIVADSNYQLLAILSLSSLGVYGIFTAGWASSSKYAFLGALRSAAQMVSYEVSISLVLLPVILLSGSLNFTQIAMAQSWTLWFVVPLLPCAIVYLVSMLAETNRTPFDLPEAEAELVAGYNVEYGSIIFSMFFLGEYGNMILMSVICAILFLGAWLVPFSVYTPVVVLVLKAIVICFFFILVRATFPRYRYDQLMNLGWKLFLPAMTGFLVFISGIVISADAVPVQLMIVEASFFPTMLTFNTDTLFSFLLSLNSAELLDSTTEFKLLVQTSESFSQGPELFTLLVGLPFIAIFGLTLRVPYILTALLLIELLYLGVVSSFSTAIPFAERGVGLIYSLFLMVLAAAESAVGLGILIVLYRFGSSILFKNYQYLRGSFLLFAFTDYTAQTYTAVILYLALAMAVCALLAGLAFVFSLSMKSDSQKLSEYECGFEPFDSATRLPFDVHFYLVGILFLVFDVEIALLFPWVLSLNVTGWFGFYLVMAFIFLLGIGFLYEWKRGALIWPARQADITANKHIHSFFIPALFIEGDFSQESFWLLPGELFLAISICAILIFLAIGLDFTANKKDLTLLSLKWLSRSMLVTAFLYVYQLQSESMVHLNSYIISSTGVTTLKLVLVLSSVFILYNSQSYIREHRRHLLEYPLIVALATFFLLLLLSSNHLMGAFFAIIGFSLNLYILILFNAPEHGSHEAGIKYYYLSTFSSGFVAYSLFLFFVVARTLYLDEMADLFVSNSWLLSGGNSLFIVATVLLLVGLLFKLSAAPTHLWAPEVYEGSPNPIMAFFMLPVKIAVLGFTISLLPVTFDALSHIWQPILSLATATSLAVGCFGALYARKLKTFMAYASINQMGFLLIGVSSHSFEGLTSTLTYLFIYAVMNVIFLIIFLNVRRENGFSMTYLTDLRGFGQQHWLLSWSFVISIFSMAGIPPLAGFFGKYYLLLHAQEQGLYLLVIVALVTSLVSTYYYLRLIRIMWFEGHINAGRISCNLTYVNRVVLLAAECALFVCIFHHGVYISSTWASLVISW
jgi:NADH-quinone oxidoreductase subunit H